MYDVIPDIHGHADKLTTALRGLGYAPRNGAWRHADRNRQVVFLGDFIDRGPENARVIRIVRDMIEAGSAQAVMGNHELNAIHFHAEGPKGPLRARTAKNQAQHGAFLKEFPLGSGAAKDVLDWMKTLPLFLEVGGFRAVHACWDDADIALLKQDTKEGRLSDAQFHRAADPEDAIYGPVDRALKGPVMSLPNGYFFDDGGGHRRYDVRRKWWLDPSGSWRDLAISVPDPSQLPDRPVPPYMRGATYPKDAVPVFIGHYWMTGEPVLQADNVMCLDYSAGLDGPLMSYSVPESAGVLSLDHVRVHR